MPGRFGSILILCNNLGIPIAPEQTCSPATTLTFAGIELDSIKSEARLPKDKIAKVRSIYFNFLTPQKGDT